MDILFKPTFIKDFKKLPRKIKEKVRDLCLKDFVLINDLKDFKRFQIKPIKNFRGYYRIKLDNYRIGFKKTNGKIIFMRIKHRKDIYRYFP